MTSPAILTEARMRPLPHLIFLSRWLQVPLYLGLIVAQVVYVFHFWIELFHLIEAAMGTQPAIDKIILSVTPVGQAPASDIGNPGGHPGGNPGH